MEGSCEGGGNTGFKLWYIGTTPNKNGGVLIDKSLKNGAWM